MSKTKHWALAALNRDEAKVLGEETPVVLQLLKDSVGNVLEIGRRMQRVRDVAGEVAFHGWLETELDVSRATASRYRSAARYFGNRPSLAGFQPTALFLLARKRVPEAARDEACRLAAAGERITVRRAREIVAQYVPLRHRSRRKYSFKTFCRIMKSAALAMSSSQIRILGGELLQLAEDLDTGRTAGIPAERLARPYTGELSFGRILECDAKGRRFEPSGSS